MAAVAAVEEYSRNPEYEPALNLAQRHIYNAHVAHDLGPQQDINYPYLLVLEYDVALRRYKRLNAQRTKEVHSSASSIAIDGINGSIQGIIDKLTSCIHLHQSSTSKSCARFLKMAMMAKKVDNRTACIACFKAAHHCVTSQASVEYPLFAYVSYCLFLLLLV